MARHKSAMKSHRQSIRRSLRNKSVKSRIRNLRKKLSYSLKLKKIEESQSILHKAQSTIMRAATKKVLKLNNASRIVSKLTKKVKAALITEIDA